MHILILEAYDGGSHKQFLDGLIKHSRHNCTRLGLPARKWKWRMRGSAIYFARQLEQLNSTGKTDLNEVDLIFTSDMTSVADLRALLPAALKEKPLVCYFHENQLTYPLPDESQRDYQYGFTNITSCLTADAVWFNSHYHQKSFLEAVGKLLEKMPDFVPENIAETILAKSEVLPLGLSPELLQLSRSDKKDSPPTLLWNHRWEYDKNPDEFFEALFDLHKSKVDFRLIVAGETFRDAPPIFAAAHKILTERIDHWGYAADRQEYLQLLTKSDIVISTAIHEFYGLSVREAIAGRCYPLLPNRLSYPELIPAKYQSHHLYNSPTELRSKLTELCQNPLPDLPAELLDVVRQITWPELIGDYDNAFEKVAGRS